MEALIGASKYIVRVSMNSDKNNSIRDCSRLQIKPIGDAFSMEDFIRMSHSIGNNTHHIEWCTKYRYKMLKKPSSMESLRRILIGIAKTHKIKIIEMAIQPEHVHMIVQLHPSMSQSKTVQILKGGSSYQMFREHPNMRKR